MKEIMTFLMAMLVFSICIIYKHTIDRHEKFVDCVFTVDLNEYESDLELDQCYIQLDKNLIFGAK